MRTRENNKGVAAIEFALILPVLVLLLFGIIEFSLLLYNQHVITNASREGARAGIVQAIPRVSSSAITGVVNNYSAGRLITFGTPNTPQVNIPAICVAFGNDLAITVSYNYDYLVLPLADRTLTARTVMKCE